MATRLRLLERLGVIIESKPVRTLLVLLVIVSVLPNYHVVAELRGLFLGVFGLELLIRAPLAVQRRRTGKRDPGEHLFLFIDFIAFLSFLPLEQWVHPGLELLAVMRMSRLATLLRFAKGLSRDLYQIITRREQLQQFGLVTGAVLGIAFISAVTLSQFHIRHDYDQDGTANVQEPFHDHLWWSFRQLESPDNLVQNLQVHPFVVFVSLCLTVMGVFIISFVIGIGTNIVEQVVRAERRREVAYRGHTVVIGPIANSATLVREFVRIYAKNRTHPRDQLRRLWRWMVAGEPLPRPRKLPKMAILEPSQELPAVLYEKGMRWVVHREGEGANRDDLLRIGADRAKRAIFIAEHAAGVDADAITLARLSAFRELNPEAHVFVELLDSRNHRTVDRLGGTSATFPLDMPWFLGIFLLNHLIVDNIEALFQYLLTAKGSELYTHIYLAADELRAIETEAGSDTHLPFDRLSALASRFNITLVGVLLGDGPVERLPNRVIPMRQIREWLNPLAPTTQAVTDLGGAPNRIPVQQLRGIIAAGETYEPVRDFSLALTRGAWKTAPGSQGPVTSSDVRLGRPAEVPKDLLVIGHSPALLSFAKRLGELQPLAKIHLAIDHAQRDTTHALLGVDLDIEHDEYIRRFEEGGVIQTTSQYRQAIDAARAYLKTERCDALVLLADEGVRDPDARTALRMLHLAEHYLEHRDTAVPTILCEFSHVARGERARREIESAFRHAGRALPRLIIVSTDQVRNYFLVHSAFVPGIHQVYATLLGERGQDLVRLPVAHQTPTQWRTLQALAKEERAIAIAYEDAQGRVTCNPAEKTTIECAVAIFVIQDLDGR